MADSAHITADFIRSRLYYDPATGIFTRLPRPVRTKNDKMWNGRYAGKPAGSINQGRILITIGDYRGFAHRLAWLYVHGEWPPLDLDHKDRDPLNNRIDNLRPATQQQNCRNMSVRSNNTSGVPGVYWNTERQKWQAFIKYDGKLRSLGRYKSKDEAIRVRNAAAKRHYGEFAHIVARA